jgi:hypothetical protein
MVKGSKVQAEQCFQVCTFVPQSGRKPFMMSTRPITRHTIPHYPQAGEAGARHKPAATFVVLGTGSLAGAAIYKPSNVFLLQNISFCAGAHVRGLHKREASSARAEKRNSNTAYRRVRKMAEEEKACSKSERRD